MPEAPDTDVVPIRWIGSAPAGHLEMLDQRELPEREIWLEMNSAKEVADGIRDMVIRGAPAIGIAAAYGMALGIRNYAADPMTSLHQEVDRLVDLLGDTRPTAVNLRWALKRCRELIDAFDGPLEALVEAMFDEASAIYDEDRQNNVTLGSYGADLFETNSRVLTHCNTGGLATGGYGTALGVIRMLDHDGKLERVWIDETRPYLQGARLTAWECLKDDLDATLITDSMAAHFMQNGEVDAVITGADRIAANGDVANKIGTYNLAVLCDRHDIPFYVAAPRSTIDLETPSGDEIPIEQRSSGEVTRIGDTSIAPDGVEAAHPAFDITPAELIDVIVTEVGVVEPPYEQGLAGLFDSR